MITAKDCHVLRKRLARQETDRRVAQSLRATKDKRFFRGRPDLDWDGFPPKPFVDHTALYARDVQKQVMAALRESTPRMD